FGVELLLGLFGHVEQHDVLFRILPELKMQERRAVNHSQAMVARNADIHGAKVQRLVVLALGPVEFCRSHVAGGLAVGGVEDAHDRVSCAWLSFVTFALGTFGVYRPVKFYGWRLHGGRWRRWRRRWRRRWWSGLGRGRRCFSGHRDRTFVGCATPENCERHQYGYELQADTCFHRASTDNDWGSREGAEVSPELGQR